MRGQFRLWPGQERELVVPNNLLDQGEEDFIKMICRDDQTVIAAGGNFYLGLCGLTFQENFTLADLVGEPTVTNNYARQPITRNLAGWPTVDLVGGNRRAVTAAVNFEAIGGNFSTGISRMFMCNAVSGSVGRLFSISGALASPLLISPGAPVPMRYELFIR